MTAFLAILKDPFSANFDWQEIPAGQSVHDFVANNTTNFVSGEEQPIVVLLDGEYVEAEKWKDTVIHKNQRLIIASRPQGLDPLTWLYIVIVAVAVAVAATTLINVPDDATTQENQSPSYSVNAQGNSPRLGEAIPDRYGRWRVFPDWAAKPYKEYIGNDEYLFQAFSIGWGSYDHTNLKIGQTDISNFDDVTYALYEPGQVVDLFRPDVYTASEVGGSGVDLFATNEPEYTSWIGPYIANASGTTTDTLAVDIQFPRGISRSNDDGGLSTRTVNLAFQYREIDGSGAAVGSWLSLATKTYSQATIDTLRYTVKKTVTSGRYEVRARRTNLTQDDFRTNDKAVWVGLRSFLETDSTFEQTVWVVKAKATSQLSAQSERKFNGEFTRKLPIWNGTVWSAETATRNPMWAYANILRAEYGGDYSDSNLNLTEIKAVADACDSRSDYYDGQFDRKGTLWAALKQVCSSCRSHPVQFGDYFSVVRDDGNPQASYMMNGRNTTKPINVTFQTMDQWADDSIEIEYTDPTSWKPERILCAIPGTAGAKPKLIKMPFLTDATQANREGMFLAARFAYRTIVTEITTELDGMVPQYLDGLQVVSHYMNWGKGGEVVAVSGQRLTLSEPVEFGASNNFIYLRADNGARSAAYAVTEVVGQPYKVDVTDSIPSYLYTGNAKTKTFFAFADGVETPRAMLVEDISRSGEVAVKIRAVLDDPRVHQYDALINSGTILTPPPQPPAGDKDLSISGVQVIYGGTSQDPLVKISWNPNGKRYFVEYSYNAGALWEGRETVVEPTITLALKNATVDIRIAAQDEETGAWYEFQIEAGSSFDAPETPSGLQLVGGVFNSSVLNIEWTDSVQAQSYYVEYANESSPTVIKWSQNVTGITTSLDVDTALLNGLSREMRVKLYGVNANNVRSNLPAEITVKNEQVAELTGVVVSAGIEQAVIEWTPSQEGDRQGVAIWASTTNGFTPSLTTLATMDAGFALYQYPTADGVAWYFKIAAFDKWGFDELNYPVQYSVTGVGVNIDLTAIEDDIAAVQLDLDAAEATLVTLDTDLEVLAGTVSTLDGDLTAAEVTLSGLSGKFPIVGTDITNSAISTEKVAANAITADLIAANSITAAKIVSGVISADKLSANSVAADKIVSGSVSADKLAANSITADKIVSGAVSADKLSANSITADKVSVNAIEASAIKASAVTADKLAVNSVTAAKIVGGTITGDKLVANTITSDKVDTRNLTIKDDDGNVIFGSGQNVDYSRVGGTKPPANAAVNSPSIGAKSNYLTFESANNGEIYIHGFNAEGQAADIPGYISYNGEQISIQGKILTGNGTTTGFLVYDPDPADLTGYTRPYLVNSVAVDKVFAKKEGQQWSYDDNTTWVPFTPSATAVVFGEAITTSRDNVASASAWGYGRSPASIVDPNATEGATWGNNVTGQPSDTELSASTGMLETFQYDSISELPWTGLSNGAGELELTIAAGGEVGGKVLQIGNNSGNDEAWLVFNKSIPYNPSKIYRIAFRVKRLSGTGFLYLGVSGRNATDTNWVNKNGAASYSSQHYFAASGATPGTEWVTYVGFFSGSNTTGNGVTTNSYDSPATLHEDAKYFRPHFIVNYNDAPGQVQVDGVVVEVLSANPDATVGADSSNLAVGSGLNLVANASFDEGLQNISFWQPGPVTVGLDYSPSTTLKNGHTVFVQQASTNPDPNQLTNINFGTLGSTDNTPVTIGERLEGSLYVGALRCEAVLLVVWLSSTQVYLSSTTIETIYPDEASGGTDIDGYKRMGGFVTVPNIADVSYGRLCIQKKGTESGSVDSFLYATRPMLARAFTNQTELSEWNPGTTKTNWENIPERPDASALLNNLQTFGDIQGDKPHIDADVTSANIAAGFADQGSLASLNSVAYSSNFITGTKPPSDAEANVGPNLIRNAELGGPKTPASSTASQVVEGWTHYTNNVSESYVKNATVSEIPPWGKLDQRIFHTAITATLSGATGRWTTAATIPIDITKNYNLSGWFRSVSGDGRVYLRLQCVTASGSSAAYQYLQTLSNTPITSTWTRYDKAFGPQGEQNFSSDTVAAFVQVYVGYAQISVTQGAGFVLNEGLTPQKIDAIEKFPLSYLSTVDYSSNFISGTKPPSNATAGATWGSNIGGQPSNNALLNSNQNYSDVTGGPPTNADNTGSNTALNVVGQTDFATLSQINADNISTYISGAAIDTAQIKTAAIGTLQIENNQTIFIPKLVAFNAAIHTLYAYYPDTYFFQNLPHTVTTFSFANAMAQTSVMLNVRFNGNLQKVGFIRDWRVILLRKIGSGDFVKIGNISNLSPPAGDYEFDVWFTDNPGAGTVTYAVGTELTGDWNFSIGYTVGYFRTNCSGQIVLMGGKR